MSLIVERLSARLAAEVRRAAAAAAWPLLLTLSLAACGGGLGSEDVPSAAPAAPGTAVSSAPSAAPVSPLTPHQE